MASGVVTLWPMLLMFLLMDLSLNFTQVLQLSAMPTLAVAVVESSLTMLDAQGLSPLSSAAQIVELESTAADTVTMLESGVWVCSCCNHSFKAM